MTWRVLEGDCREVLATLPERSVHTVVTSIELNPEYAEMARDRIATDIRLGHRPPAREQPLEGQASFFDDGELVA